MSEIIIKIKGDYNTKSLKYIFDDILISKLYSDKGIYLEYKI